MYSLFLLYRNGDDRIAFLPKEFDRTSYDAVRKEACKRLVNDPNAAWATITCGVNCTVVVEISRKQALKEARNA